MRKEKYVHLPRRNNSSRLQCARTEQDRFGRRSSFVVCLGLWRRFLPVLFFSRPGLPGKPSGRLHPNDSLAQKANRG